jgi:hypothetical protein
MGTHKLLKSGALSAVFALAFSTAAIAQPTHFSQKAAAPECTGALQQALDAAGKKNASSVPELSVNAAGTAAVILVCGLLVIAGRRRKSGDQAAA